MGCGRSFEQGPDYSTTYESYEDPQGSLPTEGVEEIMNAAIEARQQVEEVKETEFLLETLEEVADEIAEVAGEDGVAAVSLTGEADVESICPGHGEESTANVDNGAGRHLAPPRHVLCLWS